MKGRPIVAKRSKTGCWLVTSHRPRGGGYIPICRDGVIRYLHRVMYEQAAGLIPSGMNVLHKCDLPECINPSHLFLGTQADNVRDMTRKGRHGDVTGEKNPSAKLTAEQVREIRRDNRTLMPIAEKYNVTMATISDVKRRETWSTI